MKYRIAADGRSALLNDTEVVIGRSAYSTLIVEHVSVSRVHASLRLVDDGVIELRDLGSSNGTSVNGVRIAQPVRLAPGDHVTIGRVPLEIEPIGPRLFDATSQRDAIVDAHDDGPLENTAVDAKDPHARVR